ncbi:Hypothetical predicted protein [Octopus vulgaris]|uniref:Uncharacterized protein n=1 Tax=Octopus vulgaris TaxID=6645 RepID=A0AA36B6U1_OCTVU|nr:Hypothetical predicted protein [Octopus vulgaris]
MLCELPPQRTSKNNRRKPSQVCEAANKEIQKILDEETTTVLRGEKHKRGEYTKFTTTELADLVRYPIQHGNMEASRHFAKIYGCSVSESTIHGNVKKLKNELKSTKNIDDVFELPPAKRGRPLLQGEDLDNHMIHHIMSLRDSGSIVSKPIVMASALGIVKTQDHTQLKEYKRHDAKLFNAAQYKAKTRSTKALVRGMLFVDDSLLVAHSAEDMQKLDPLQSEQNSQDDDDISY